MKHLSFALLLVCLPHATALAVPPNFINYQGRLKDTLGNPVADNVYAVTFSLYSVPSGGSAIWTEVQPVTTTNGLFSTILGATTPFDATSFSDSVRYLGIKVGADPEISPRSRLASVPFALTANSGWIDDGGVVRLRTTTDWVGIGTSTPIRPFQLYDAAGVGFMARIGSPNLDATITEFANLSAGATWELSIAGSNGIPGWGVQPGDLYFYRQGTSYPNAIMTAGGKLGLGTALPRARLETVTTDTIAGLFGSNNASNATHVIHSIYTGLTSADAIAVYGRSVPADYYGIGGEFEGGYIGAYGHVDQPGSHAYYGLVGMATGDGTGRKSGVYGSSFSSGGSKFGVRGEGSGTAAVGDTVAGVFGEAISSSTTYICGVFGRANGDVARGVVGEGTGFASAGGRFSSVGPYAVAVEAITSTDSVGAVAGRFIGNVSVQGVLSKTAGSFRIDHPLDPENKLLQHSFVESPDMMDIYNGNVTTDASGNATITLPNWFEALNRDFRYQLTVIGQFAQAIVSSKISHNQFSIRTDKPNVEVSWQVTGIRHDPFAEAHRIQVEVDKNERERGKYIAPEAYGKGREFGIGYPQELEPTASSLPSSAADQKLKKIRP